MKHEIKIILILFCMYIDPQKYHFQEIKKKLSGKTKCGERGWARGGVEEGMD